MHALISKLGLLSKSNYNAVQVIPPFPATERELCVYHDSEYISFVLNPANSRRNADGDKEQEFENFGLEDVYNNYLILFSNH